MQAFCLVLAVFLAFIIPQIDVYVQWCNAFGVGQETLITEMKNTVREKRKSKGLTQKELWRLAGVSQTTISHIESGNYILMIDTVLKIAAVLGVTVDELFTPSDPPKKYDR